MSSERTVDLTGGWDQSPSLAAVAVADVLSRQEREWDGGSRPAVEELLAEYPQFADHPNAVLELICNEVVLREERNEKPSLVEYQARFPELAEVLRVQWEVDRALFSRRSRATPSVTGEHTPAEPMSVTTPLDPKSQRGRPAAQTIGRYRVDSILGKGGMGIAYRAWDPDLKRVVALKTLRVAHADEHEIARFRTESEAIARVRHPNIVQVFDVGEQVGQPFFAMEFCSGGSLAGRLKDLPLSADDAATAVEQIARGVDAAHRQGIVHRDLKPANVLLSHLPAAAGVRSTVVPAATPGPSSVGSAPREPVAPEPVVYKVTDFGLAKSLDDDDGLTRTGAVMGTPAYMSPEQAFGHTKQVGPAADVYALGAILYECLTGRPPFQGASVADTLEQVRTREPVPIRQLQPKVHVDLETVAAKCLQKDIGKRYATAEALADDLRRYLERRPILARPVGSLERGWRWCRRNPLVAVLLAAVFLTFSFGLAGTTIMWRQAVAQRAKAEENFAEAEENLRETFRAVNKAFVLVGEDQLLAEPGMTELRVKLLSASRPYFESFVAKRRGDPKWKHELAHALARLAAIAQLLESPGESLTRWREASQSFEEILRERPDSADDRYELAQCLVSIGYQEFKLDQYLEAERDFLSALAHFQGLPDRASRGGLLVSAESITLTHLGHVARLRGNPAAADGYHQQAVRLLEGQGATPAVQLELGKVLFMRGKSLMETGDSDGGIVELVKAAKVFEAAAAKPGREQVAARRNLASTMSVLGVARAASTSVPREQALAAGEKTLSIARLQWEALCNQQPSILAFQDSLAECEFLLAGVLIEAKKPDDAEKHARAALKRRELLFPRHPGDRAFLLDVAESLHQVTTIMMGRTGQATDAAQEERLAPVLLESAGKELDFLVGHAGEASYPDKVRDRIPNVSSMRARILKELKRYDEARTEWDRAIAFARPEEREGFVKERQALPGATKQ